MRKWIYALLFWLAGLSAQAQLTYEQASIRAERFFGFREWASASALYNYMLQHEPKQVDTYGHAIVAQEMLNDTIQSMELLKRAMAYKIPLDSVLSSVKKYSFEVGKSEMYEKFMLQSARANPWLSRPLDSQLLKYYAFRNDGPKMIEYSKAMLNGAPNDIRFLSSLAKGYMLTGATNDAIATWNRILEINPDEYHTLLCLANYYYVAGDKAKSIPLFIRAQALNPTPYVGALLSANE